VFEVGVDIEVRAVFVAEADGGLQALLQGEGHPTLRAEGVCLGLVLAEPAHVLAVAFGDSHRVKYIGAGPR